MVGRVLAEEQKSGGRLETKVGEVLEEWRALKRWMIATIQKARLVPVSNSQSSDSLPMRLDQVASPLMVLKINAIDCETTLLDRILQNNRARRS